jgi:hypothetical protein
MGKGSSESGFDGSVVRGEARKGSGDPKKVGETVIGGKQCDGGVH